ncbi:MAG: 50S ribosomal protein L25 [bacterium]
MSDYKIEAQLRTEKINKVRAENLIPGVIYGKGFKNISLSMKKVEIDNLFRHAGTSNLVEVAVDGKKYKTLIHDTEIEPIRNSIIHVDFYKVNMKEKITAEIPLKFINESPAVVNLDGSLITPVDSIEVECLPGDLISEIEVDLSSLENFEKDIRVSDIKLAEGITILSDPEEIIAFVQEPRSEEELEALDAEVVENIDAIEVENKGEAPVEEATDEKKSE